MYLCTYNRETFMSALSCIFCQLSMANGRTMDISCFIAQNCEPNICFICSLLRTRIIHSKLLDPAIIPISIIYEATLIIVPFSLVRSKYFSAAIKHCLEDNFRHNGQARIDKEILMNVRIHCPLDTSPR